MLLGIEYQNWYQVLRPFGSNVLDKSRIEVLKLADESDLRLRDNVPWGITRSRESLSAAVANQFASSQSLQKQSSEIITLLGLKKTDGTTYLSPRLKEFQDQDKEIEDIFWNLLKTASPTCPDDLDIEGIRAALAERQAKLGRDQQKEDDEEDNPFDKYGLGLHAKRPIGTEEQRPGAGGQPGEGLLEMIDRMVAERTKPPPEKKDLYDKNNPIKGKVGFRRDPDGPRCFTELDEELSFGDLDKDTDFRRYLVETGRGKFDSEGNFIPLDTDEKNKKKKKTVSLADGSDDGLGTTTSFTKGKHRKTKTTEGSSTGDSGRKKSRGRTFSTMTEAERAAYLRDLNKQRRHPEWEFPLCNYPKWVHRMYRMDQEKIGQLIKQGLDVPEYVPPWMVSVLDRVWGAKDPTSRGQQPSKGGRKGRTGGGLLDENKRRDKGAGASAGGAGGGDGKKGSVAAGKDGADGGGLFGDELAKLDLEGTMGEKEPADGMADFLQGYEKEMIDLAKLEAADSAEKLRREDDTIDMDDLIADYEKELERQERQLLDEREKNRGAQREDKLRIMKEKQAAALRRIQEQTKKEQQEKNMKEEAAQEKLEKKQALLEKLKGDDSTHKYGGTRRGRHTRKDQKSKKSSTASTEPCGEFKTTAGNPATDAECMRRFRVLLGRQNERMSAADFIELLRQEIPLFRYEPAPPKKTPCETAEVPIC